MAVAGAVSHLYPVANVHVRGSANLAPEVVGHAARHDFPRTRTVTWSAHLARYGAACPAELPPPATNTLRPLMAGASLVAAP